MSFSIAVWGLGPPAWVSFPGPVVQVHANLQILLDGSRFSVTFFTVPFFLIIGVRIERYTYRGGVFVEDSG